jgi:hypothetical protein
MKRSLLCVLFLLCSTRTLAAFTGEQGGASTHAGPATYDAESFAVMLNHLVEILKKKPSPAEIGTLRGSLPKSWIVSTPERTYNISSDPLRDDLAANSIEKARVRVNHMIAEVDGFSLGKTVDTREARTELDQIMARPEFARVRPLTPWEALRQRISAWLQRQLMTLFQAIGRHPIGGEILFWMIILGAVGAIAYGVIRFLADKDSINSLPRSGTMVTARLWQEWMRAAREAADRGDYREAVHSAYWAGIVKLQDVDALPRDRTKTPREYLRLVNPAAANEHATAIAVCEPLAALTSRLEHVWYANRGAGPEDFRMSLHQLEALGCRLE